MRSPLQARHAIIVAPHPDDEAIAAWALMRQLRRRGARVDVVVVSDGGASHPGSQSWPVPRLVAERERETRRAMRMLGISPERISFLRLPDGALPDCPGRIVAGFRRTSLGRGITDLVVGPLPDDAHADHRAVAAALAIVPRRGGQRLGYRVWPRDAAPSPRGPQVRIRPAAMAIKRRSVRSYRTQAGLITDAQAGFAMTHRHLQAFVRPAERFTILP